MHPERKTSAPHKIHSRRIAPPSEPVFDTRVGAASSWLTLELKTWTGSASSI